MKIVVSEYKKISPFIGLFCAENKTAKMILKLIGKEHFDNKDLFALQKAGYTITKVNTQIRKIS